MGEHADKVTAIAYSPNGKLVASADYGGGVAVWDSATRKQLQMWRQSGSVLDLAFYSNDILLVANEPEGIDFLDVRTGGALQGIEAETSVRALALAPDRSRLALLAAPNDDQVVQVWSLSEGGTEERPAVELLYSLPGIKTTSRSYLDGTLTFSPDGDELAVGYHDGSVRVYETSSGRQRLLLQAHEGYVATIAYSVDGRLLASGAVFSDPTVKIWDVETGQLLRELPGHGGSPREVAFSGDGAYLLAVCGHQKVVQWRVHDWSLQRTFQGHDLQVLAVAIAPDSRSFVTGGKDQKVLAWDPSRSSQRLEPLRIVGMRHFDFSPAGSRLATVEAGRDDPARRVVALYEGEDFQERNEIPALGNDVLQVAFSPDGTRLAALGHGIIQVWDSVGQSVSAGRPLPWFSSWVLAGFSADGSGVILVDQEYQVAHLNRDLDLESSWVAHTPPSASMQSWSTSVAFHADSGTLVLGGNGAASVWDVRTRAMRGVLRGHQSTAVTATLSLDGNWIATVGEDGRAFLWDAGTLERVITFQGPQSSFSCAAFSPDTRRLAIGTGQSAAAIFDVETGRQLFQLPDVGAVQLGWSLDGKVLVTRSTDGIIWRTPSRRTTNRDLP